MRYELDESQECYRLHNEDVANVLTQHQMAQTYLLSKPTDSTVSLGDLTIELHEIESPK